MNTFLIKHGKTLLIVPSWTNNASLDQKCSQYLNIDVKSGQNHNLIPKINQEVACTIILNELKLLHLRFFRYGTYFKFRNGFFKYNTRSYFYFIVFSSCDWINIETSQFDGQKKNFYFFPSINWKEHLSGPFKRYLT